MSEMMKSVRQTERGGELEILSIPLPEPGPGEVLVKILGHVRNDEISQAD